MVKVRVLFKSMEELIMLERIQILSVVGVTRITKGVLVFVIIGFFFIQCENPLGSLFDDVSIRSNKDQLLINEGESDSIGFRLNAKPINQATVILRANLTCKGMSTSEQNSHVTINKNTIIWGENNWATWQDFTIVAHDNAKQKPTINCTLVSAPLQSNDGGFNDLMVKAISITIFDNDVLVDFDHDGLIEIKNATMLNNMRYELAGTSYKTSASDGGNTDGCPAVVNGSGGCHGYELSVNIDLLDLLDTNGNGKIDTTMEGIDKNADGDTIDPGEKVTVIDITADTSWVPVGDNSTGDDTTRFTGTFEGNHHTIANLWVNITPSSGNAYAGLFGVTGGTVAIRNVGIISGSIHSASRRSSSSGCLVGNGGNATVTITNSYCSGTGGVFSSAAASSFSGGLVGKSDMIMITNSYFSGAGGVSSSSKSFFSSSSGGLVGEIDAGTIMNSYFSGAGVVSSSSDSDSFSGGLVGRVMRMPVSIRHSHFSGVGGVSSFFSVSSSASRRSSFSGGLVGGGSGVVAITNSYWSTNAPQSVNGMSQSPQRVKGDVSGILGSLTFMQLKAITISTTSSPSPSGLPHSATDKHQSVGPGHGHAITRG